MDFDLGDKLELERNYLLLGFVFFKGLLADNFNGGDFSVFHVLDFIASGEPPLSQKLTLFELPDNGAVGFVRTFFDDFWFVV